MGKTILFFLLAIIFGITGCALLDPHTAFTDIMRQAGSMFWPIVVFSVSGLSALLAWCIPEIVSLSRKSTLVETALTAVVEGVNVYAKDETGIKELMVNAGAAKEKVDVIFGNASKIKRMVQVFASERNIEPFLKLFVKTAEVKEDI